MKKHTFSYLLHLEPNQYAFVKSARGSIKVKRFNVERVEKEFFYFSIKGFPGVFKARKYEPLQSRNPFDISFEDRWDGWYINYTVCITRPNFIDPPKIEPTWENSLGVNPASKQNILLTLSTGEEIPYFEPKSSSEAKKLAQQAAIRLVQQQKTYWFFDTTGLRRKLPELLPAITKAARATGSRDIKVNPQYTGRSASYDNWKRFGKKIAGCWFWDEEKKIWVHAATNAALNLKKVGLGWFQSAPPEDLGLAISIQEANADCLDILRRKEKSLSEKLPA